MKILKIIITLISLMFNGLIYRYLNRLENIKCNCSIDWKRNVLQTFTMYNFVFLSCSLIYPKVPISVSYLMSFYSTVYFIFILSYTHELREKRCYCAKGLDSDIIYYYYYSRLMLYLFIICMSILIFFSSFIYLITK